MQRKTHAFVVRIWNDAAENDSAPRWRGYVQHVNAPQKFHFTHLDQLVRLIANQLDRADGKERDAVEDAQD